ncbi:RNA polymerase subunit sigma-70 [Methylobacterium radiodurans]|uniref:RNA polymerase sigma factor n=1 Tax=Methylobacterium radiodurans TaxID=2202828 RepID=A0A2U8VP70_9HYPH|nr:RNA polymerase subunit sigma-70 [Methylobacterium radiodurans]
MNPAGSASTEALPFLLFQLCGVFVTERSESPCQKLPGIFLIYPVPVRGRRARRSLAVSGASDRADGVAPVQPENSGTTRDGAGALPPAVRDHLGAQLRESYALLIEEPAPDAFVGLIRRLVAALDGHAATEEKTFGEDLIAALPALRAFALSLAVSAARADDLVQETVLKAWANREKFRPGTNFTAWLFTILRNQFYSEIRKHRREIEDVDGAAAATMISLPDQVERIALQNVWSTMAKLPASQREALLLVGAHGLTYEAAAEVIGCQTGTVKSRVSRARAWLADALGLDRAEPGLLSGSPRV